MKAFKEVEANRRLYHSDPIANSVHRSSLLVAEMPGAVAEISFVNHFLLKRNYTNVGLRVTGVDHGGSRVESRLFAITEPRVHNFTLTGMFDDPIANYLVEFFAAENLFIPFPAVMVNHRGPGFLNTVHSYNRALNDIFEDDAINEKQVAECSIDVLPEPLQTFLLFTAGPAGACGDLELELATPDTTWNATVPVVVSRFGHHPVKVREVFPDLPADGTGVLKVRQPPQPMFYGRMLCGHLDAEGRFTANHSYYDSSTVEEYWDDARDSYRTYPYLPGIDNRIRMYPTMSPSTLTISASLRGADGIEIAQIPAGEVTSPGTSFLDVSIDSLAESAGIDPADVRTFTLYASGEKVPTRINHQLIHSTGGLESSINVSMINPNVYQPSGKTGLTWGQFPVGGPLHSRLGIVVNDPTGEPVPVEVTFYGEDGELGTEKRTLVPGDAVIFDSLDFETRNGEMDYLWFYARSPRADISALVASLDTTTGSCTGEHSF